MAPVKAVSRPIKEKKTDPIITVPKLPEAPKQKRLIGVIKRGRKKGHGNDWVRAVLVYYARFKKLPSGVSKRMEPYYKNHPDMPIARAHLRALKKGEEFDYERERKKRRGK